MSYDSHAKTKEALDNMLLANAFAVQATSQFQGANINLDFSTTPNFPSTLRSATAGEYGYTPDAVPSYFHSLRFHDMEVMGHERANRSDLRTGNLENKLHLQADTDYNAQRQYRVALSEKLTAAKTNYDNALANSDFEALKSAMQEYILAMREVSPNFHAIRGTLNGTELRQGIDAQRYRLKHILSMYGYPEGRSGRSPEYRIDISDEDRAKVQLAARAYHRLNQVAQAVDELAQQVNAGELNPLSRNIDFYVTLDINAMITKDDIIPINLETAALMTHFQNNAAPAVPDFEFEPTVAAEGQKKKGGWGIGALFGMMLMIGYAGR